MIGIFVKGDLSKEKSLSDFYIEQITYEPRMLGLNLFAILK